MIGSALSEVLKADEDMTGKARRYMLYMAIYGLAMGFVCMFTSSGFSSPSFDVLKQVLPFGNDMQAWGVAHALVGLTALTAAVRRAPNLATLALMGIASLTLAFAVSFALAYYALPGAAPTGFIIYGIFSIVNIDQSREPRTAPVERVVRKLVNAGAQ